MDGLYAGPKGPSTAARRNFGACCYHFSCYCCYHHLDPKGIVNGPKLLKPAQTAIDYAHRYICLCILGVLVLL